MEPQAFAEDEGKRLFEFRILKVRYMIARLGRYDFENKADPLIIIKL